ncbi:MAG: hypothetical protein QXY62_03045 [Candidatus Altiarchaeota archaeon]
MRKSLMLFVIASILILFFVFIFTQIGLKSDRSKKEAILNITQIVNMTISATPSTIISNVSTTSATLLREDIQERYPIEPKIEDCKKLKTHQARNFCYSDAAEVLGNEKICEYIIDKEVEEHCMARVTLNESRCCEIFDKGLREGCLDSINYKKNFLGINISNITCKNISINPDEYSYLNMKYISYKLVPIIKTIKNYDYKAHLILSLARRLRDLYLCSEMDSILINSTLKTRCYAEISRLMKNVSICEFINWSERDREFCRVFTESGRSNNYDLCNNLRESYYRDMCYLRMAVIKNDESICYKQSNDDRVSLCISGLRRDNKFCANIKDIPTKSNCYFWVAYLHEDSTLCNNENMLRDDWDICYLEIAIQKYNLTICEKINDVDLKEYCFNAVEFLY